MICVHVAVQLCAMKFPKFALVCTHVQKHTHIHAHAHAHTYPNWHTMHAYICTYARTYSCICHIYINACIYVPLYVFIWYIHAYTHTHLRRHTNTYARSCMHNIHLITCNSLNYFDFLQSRSTWHISLPSVCGVMALLSLEVCHN